jgi:hypothetical protein
MIALELCVSVNQMLHIAHRAKALSYGYEARLRGLELCAVNLTNTIFAFFASFAVNI